MTWKRLWTETVVRVMLSIGLIATLSMLTACESGLFGSVRTDDCDAFAEALPITWYEEDTPAKYIETQILKANAVYWELCRT